MCLEAALAVQALCLRCLCIWGWLRCGVPHQATQMIWTPGVSRWLCSQDEVFTTDLLEGEEGIRKQFSLLFPSENKPCPPHTFFFFFGEGLGTSTAS